MNMSVFLMVTQGPSTGLHVFGLCMQSHIQLKQDNTPNTTCTRSLRTWKASFILSVRDFLNEQLIYFLKCYNTNVYGRLSSLSKIKDQL